MGKLPMINEHRSQQEEKGELASQECTVHLWSTSFGDTCIAYYPLPPYIAMCLALS